MDLDDAQVFLEGALITQSGEVAKREVLLVSFLVDDSHSIEGAGNTQAVIDGFNRFLMRLQEAVEGTVLLRVLFLNGELDTGFQDPKYILPLSRATYRPDNNTPLYARSVYALSGVQEEAGTRVRATTGMKVRSMTLIFTDGADNQSHQVKAENVRMLAEAMWATGTNIIGGCAVDDGHTNFWQVFASMGIPERWIKVLSGKREIQTGFETAGDSVIFASQSEDSFTETSTTGFGMPPRQ